MGLLAAHTNPLTRPAEDDTENVYLISAVIAFVFGCGFALLANDHGCGFGAAILSGITGFCVIGALLVLIGLFHIGRA